MESTELDLADRFTFAGTLLAALGSGLIAGTFFAFSTFVMKALGQRPPAEGLAAMQAINVVVINPAFMAVFMGTVALCLALPVGAWWSGPMPGRAWLIAGCALYLFGTFGVTIAFNVPLNDALAPLTPTDPAAQQQWANYLRTWTLWNHVRTAGGLAASAAFMLALRR